MKTNNNPLESQKRLLFLLGGVSAFVLVMGYLSTFPLYAMVGGSPPAEILSRLQYFASSSTSWWIILSIMVITDLLYIPIFYSLFHSMNQKNKHWMLLASTFIGLFIILDISITWTAYSVLLTAGKDFINTVSEVQKEGIIAAASYATELLNSPLIGIFAIVFPAIGELITSVLLVRDQEKVAGYWGIITGLSGIAYIGSYINQSLEPLRIVNALFVTVWFIFIGIRLLRMKAHE
jgi:hypothetical protein